MKIVFLTTSSLDSPYGQGRCLPFARQLAAAGNEVHIVALHHDLTRDTPKYYLDGNVHVHYAGQMHVRKRGDDTIYFDFMRLLWIVLTGGIGLTTAALRLKADVYHIGKPHIQNSLAGLIAARLLRRILVLDYDDFEAEINRFANSWQRRIAAWLEDNVPVMVDGVTYHTTFLGDRLRTLHISPQRLLKLPTCVDSQRFAPSDNHALSEWRQRLDLGDAWVISYIGTLSLTNHPVDLLLAALTELVQNGENVLLLIAGGGPDKKQLEAFAAQLGISERCRFAGRVPAAAIPDLLRLSAISTDPVEDNAVARARWPLKIVESMVTGVPVVTADVGDRREMLGDGHAGLLVTPGDAHALAVVIGQLIHDPQQMARLQAGCAVQIKQYDAGAQTARLIHFYERLRRRDQPAPHSEIDN